MQDIDYSRKWYAMATVAMGVFLSTIDGSIVNIALPTLENDFATNFQTVQWVQLAYMLVITTLMLSMGRLADIVGKRLIYTAGLVIFTVGSTLCGFAPDIGWLIGFRVLQAIGAAMNMALGAAIVTEAFPPQERGKALGVIGTIVSLGVIFGPVAGGLLIDALSWHWIFFVNIPFGIAGTVMAPRFLPALKPSDTNQRFDYPGAFTLLLALVALLLALTLGQSMGFGSMPIVLLFAAAFIFLLTFILIEWKTHQPMINLSLFRNELMSVNLIMAFLSFITIAGTVLLIPFYLINVLEYSTRSAGLLMAVVPVLLGLLAPIAGSLSDRFGTRIITLIGLVVLTIGYALLSFLNENTSMLVYIALFVPVGIGMGIFQSPNNSAIMGTAPRSQLGVVSGLLSESRVLGQTMGVALMGAFWAGRVFAHLGETLEQGATAAPIAAQIAGLHDTFLMMSAMMGFATVLGIWGLVQSRRTTAKTPSVATPLSD